MRRNYLWLLLLFLTVSFGLFLRIYNIGFNFNFEGELGKELLYMRQFTLSHTIPLVGMATSHEWLFYGPVYYWIMIPVFNLFNGNPFILFWAAMAVFVIGMIINYFVVERIIDRKTAIISSLFQTISPLLVWQSRNSKLHVFFFILTPILMYLTFLLWNGKKKYLIWAGIVFGLMLSFHFSQIPLIGVFILLFVIKRNIYKWKDHLTFAAGLVIPNITYIWKDWKIFAWLPYRSLNIADKNFGGTVQSFIEYFGRTVFWDNRFWIVGLILFAAVFIHFVYTNRRKLAKEFLPFILTSTIGVVMVANIIHRAPPVHYFLPVYTIVPILYAVYLAKHKWGIYILLIMFALNFLGYFRFIKPAGYVPFTKQMVVSSFIISESKGEAFGIKRIGPYDYFPENYSQNYKYLILWKGGKLDDNSTNIYTINDTLNTVSK
jgi:4-amino-4-deoxy-L-arabinose transferase-like glycosyltransferase